MADLFESRQRNHQLDGAGRREIPNVGDERVVRDVFLACREVPAVVRMAADDEVQRLKDRSLVLRVVVCEIGLSGNIKRDYKVFGA